MQQQDLVRVPNPFIEMLVSTQVRHIRKSSPVSFLRTKNTMMDIMTYLKIHKVLSFPVLDENDECLGIVDGVDLVYFLQKHAHDSKASSRTIESFINASQANPYIPVFSTTPLHAVIAILAPGCHRTVVFESEDSYRLYSMFSESDLIAFLHYYIKHDKKNTPVQMVANLPIHVFSGSISHPTHTAFTDETVSSAFDRVWDYRSGSTASAKMDDESCSFEYHTPLVAVFDSQTKRLVAHIDAKLLGKTGSSGPNPILNVPSESTNKVENENDSSEASSMTTLLSPMHMKIKDYIATFALEALESWIVSSSISLRDLLRVLFRNRLHHVWVTSLPIKPQRLSDATVDACVNFDQTTLKGVITLNDVLRWVARDNLWLIKDNIPNNTNSSSDINSAFPSSPSDLTDIHRTHDNRNVLSVNKNS